MWCWHNIRENLNGLCPACRSPYNADPHAFSIVDQQDVLRKQKERRMKEKNERKTTGILTGSLIDKAAVARVAVPLTDRRHLHNYRVIQRNLVYVIGVPSSFSTEETLRRPEYFGQYGKIGKIVVHGNRSVTHATVSVYITFAYKEDAKAAIQVLDGFWLEGHHLRASFGTTKYCNNFIRGVPCNNPECVYLHDIGEDEDRFTKEEIQAGHSKLPAVPGESPLSLRTCALPSSCSLVCQARTKPSSRGMAARVGQASVRWARRCCLPRCSFRTSGPARDHCPNPSPGTRPTASLPSRSWTPRRRPRLT